MKKALLAIALLLTFGAATAEATSALAPPVPCTSKNKMDIFIDEDNIMWACECEYLVRMLTCHWQVIGGVDTPASRKWLRSHRIILKSRWITFERNGQLKRYYGLFVKLPA